MLLAFGVELLPKAGELKEGVCEAWKAKLGAGVAVGAAAGAGLFVPPKGEVAPCAVSKGFAGVLALPPP